MIGAAPPVPPAPDPLPLPPAGGTGTVTGPTPTLVPEDDPPDPELPPEPPALPPPPLGGFGALPPPALPEPVPPVDVLGRLPEPDPALGVAAESWDAAGRQVVDEVGELVITVPMPSMPLRFWNDPDGSRFRASYFETYPGVWRHGDLVEFAPDGSSVIVGRSDSTLNRNGIRLGPADLYRVVEALPEVKEAMVVGVEEPEGYYMPLFVQLADGVTAALEAHPNITIVRERVDHLPEAGLTIVATGPLTAPSLAVTQ